MIVRRKFDLENLVQVGTLTPGTVVRRSAAAHDVEYLVCEGAPACDCRPPGTVELRALADGEMCIVKASDTVIPIDGWFQES